MNETARAAYSLRQLLLYMLGLGSWGFGGPVALVNYMHRDLVEKRGWISEAEYKEGMTLAQLMPGPLAAQLAIYLGYVHYGILGATLVGLAFVLPSFFMVVALGWAYQRYGGLSWMQAVFFGVGSSVIAIILVSAYRLTKKSLGGDRWLWAIYLVSAVTTAMTGTERIELFLACGALVWFVRSRPKFAPGTANVMISPLLLIFTSDGDSSEKLWKIFLFFSKAGAFVFGSGLAIIPFLYSGTVKEYEWLNERQFLDAVAVAMITPGPVVITVGFIGYLVAGFPGACVAAIGTFLPCYLLTIIPAPYFKKHGKRPAITAFVDGVTAAAVGAIAGAVVILSRQTLFPAGTLDWVKATLFLITLGLLVRFPKLPEPFVILGAALVGTALFPFVAEKPESEPLKTKAAEQSAIREGRSLASPT